MLEHWFSKFKELRVINSADAENLYIICITVVRWSMRFDDLNDVRSVPSEEYSSQDRSMGTLNVTQHEAVDSELRCTDDLQSLRYDINQKSAVVSNLNVLDYRCN